MSRRNGTPTLSAENQALVAALEHRLIGDILPKLTQNFLRPQIDGLHRQVAAVVTAFMPPDGEHVLTTADLPELARGLAPWVREVVAEAVAECLKDGGTWKREILYQPNQIVTSDGTLWRCLQPNSNAKPPGDAWRQLHRTIGRK